ncbi:uncharacterized protein EDB91DRAFT_1255803 [Suillus paluster]|uniref:uncharacterized protein n=1 Tax=Suillus paluster TaxID=48578 RepID=UPI001B87099F|nr:uncharacterized protein EDB91DRAFT_1255803 [Suillus paluster]KAG1723023.1 hypothetical protein EDB91DRAFT_1255803 [Suillus paluster]
MATTNPVFPYTDRLGYTIDVTQTTSIPVNAIDILVKRGDRMINIDFDTLQQNVEFDGRKYDVPIMVSITPDVRTVESDLRHYPNGNDADAAFSNDASLRSRYFALTGTTSVAAASQKLFLINQQYMFFSFTKIKYIVNLQEYSSKINTVVLLKRVRGLPIPFDGQDSSAVAKYKDFFALNGSHVIVSASYGARYLLTVWCSNTDPAVNTMFTADVKAAVGGIPSGGIIDPTVMEEAQYKTFLRTWQYNVLALGGDRSIANKLTSNPASYKEYEEWVATTGKHPSSLLSLNVEELWNLMKLTGDPVLAIYADQLSAAFNHIITHPKVFKTAISLEIDTDWGRFDLLTPSARLLPDSDRPFSAEKTKHSDTYVNWHNGSCGYAVLYFFVINDGSPIDFSTSHGGDPAHYAKVVMEGKHYDNTIITDDRNTAWFYGAKVKDTPEPTSAQ